MVSPYLLRPLRTLEDVLSAAAVNSQRMAARRSSVSRRPSGTAASILRQQGRVARPRVVWVNEQAAPKPARKPHKPD